MNIQYVFDASSTGTGSVTGGNTITIPINPYVQTETEGGTNIKAEFKKDVETGQINVGLFFRFMKSKLSKLEKEKLKKRIATMQKLALDASDMGQVVMYEDVTRMLAVAIRESEAVVSGFDKFIDRSMIEKWKGMVKDKINVKWSTLDKFPRAIPRSPKMKIKRAQERRLFDEYWVLYTDYTKEAELPPKKTTKEKIREKDPIVFGTYKHAPDRLYFIADWVDEFCDITMDKVVEKLREDDKEFGLHEVPKIDSKFNERIKAEVVERHNRLENTNRINWRSMEAAEEKSQKDRMGFWSRFKRKKKK